MSYTGAWLVSVLFNEPKLLKDYLVATYDLVTVGFSALQRAEIAETQRIPARGVDVRRFSALQRAEIAETRPQFLRSLMPCGFSALQRAEIAETQQERRIRRDSRSVSVLFNEPKLLKLQLRAR